MIVSVLKTTFRKLRQKGLNAETTKSLTVHSLWNLYSLHLLTLEKRQNLEKLKMYFFDIYKFPK